MSMQEGVGVHVMQVPSLRAALHGTQESCWRVSIKHVQRLLRAQDMQTPYLAFGSSFYGVRP